jgi:hypothetical protein
MLTPSQMALYRRECFFQKVLAVRAPSDLFNLAMKEQKLPWLPETGLLKLDSQDFQTMP